MKIQLKRSNVLESGSAKVPTSAQLDYGELAVNYNADDPTLFLKDSNDNVIKFGGTSAYDDRYVQRAGDNMTGNLTFGADGATTPNITLDATGLATFGGDVQVGGNPKDSAGVELGTIIRGTGGIISSTSSANDITFSGKLQGQTGNTSQIDGSGAAMFAANKFTIGANGTQKIIGTGLGTSGAFHIQNDGSWTTVLTGGGRLTLGGDAGTPANANILLDGTDGTSTFKERMEVYSLIKSTSNSGFESKAVAGGAQFAFRATDNAGTNKVTIYSDGAAVYDSTLKSNGQIRGNRFKCGDNADQDRIELSAGGSIYGADGDFEVSNEGNNGARMQIKRAGNSDAFVITDMSGNAGVQLKTGGTSTFRNSIQSGYFNTTSTSVGGCSISLDGQFDAQRTSSQGNSYVFRGWQGTSNTCWIKADGSASFKSITVDGGSIPSATNADNIRCDTENATNANRFITFVDSGSGSYSRAKVDASLTYNSSTNTITAGNFNSTSDIALKQDITSIDGALSRLSNIEGVGFAWKKTGARTYGVIAQDVEKEFPELVHTDEFKTVNYNGLVGVLIEAIKELKAEVEELKKG